jgi:LysM repeat protein
MKRAVASKKVLARAAVWLIVLLVLLSASATAAAGGIHVVQRGENLSRISARYGVSINSLMQVNSIRDPNRIFIGQRLTIPSSSSSSGGTVRVATASSASVSSGCPVHRVAFGDTLSAIAARYGTTVAGIQRANSLRGTIIWPAMRLKIPCASSAVRVLPCSLTNGRYLIRPGDTLLQIALRCNTTVAALRAANGLSSDLIRAGAWLTMPGSQAVSPGPAPSSPSPPAQPAAVPTRVNVRPAELPSTAPVPGK